jgi:uncharacterized protein (TIGR02147 family)
MLLSNYLLREYLGHKFAVSNAKNEKYTLCAFSKKLGLAPQEVYPFLEGQRQFSDKKIKKVLSNISPNDDCESLNNIVNFESQFSKRKVDEDSIVKIPKENLKDFLDNDVMTLLNSLDLGDDLNGLNSSQLIELLPISKEKIENSLDLLETFGLIRRVNEGYVRNSVFLRLTGGAEYAKEIDEHHKGNLVNGINAIDNMSIDRRCTSNTKFCSSSKRIKEARKLISYFRRFIAQYLSDGEKEEVFSLNIQLHSVSNNKNKLLKDNLTSIS